MGIAEDLARRRLATSVRVAGLLAISLVPLRVSPAVALVTALIGLTAIVACVFVVPRLLSMLAVRAAVAGYRSIGDMTDAELKQEAYESVFTDETLGEAVKLKMLE